MKTSSVIKHLTIQLVLIVGIYALMPATVRGGPTVLASAVNTTNGHTYYLLSSTNWTTAEATAVSMGGHLATIRNAGENSWVINQWGSYGLLWIGLYDPVSGDGGGAQHAADFVWSSGETSAYRDWYPGEPNGPDDYTVIGSYANGYWNDATADSYGVVEISTCTPHAAKATAVLYATNFVVSATITDPGCGYTNAPTVTIQGGGGSGATATASIANGVVTAINITSTGSGYTNPPAIIIASPPFVPTVAINFSAVKVTQHVMLGNTYVLQSSSDLINWTNVGSAFTATNEYYVNEFEINTVGQYFRIQQQ